MNWLKNFVPPKLRKLVGGQKEIPDNLWHNCPTCSQMNFHRDLTQNKRVCLHCGHHFRLNGRERIDMLLNDTTYEELNLNTPIPDPLKFRDTKRYSERIKEARTKTGKQDVLTVVVGKIGPHKVVLAIFDFSFMGGSMGIAVGDSLLLAGRHAIKEGCPLVVIPSSGGARMQEGVLSLMQLPRTTVAVDKVRERNFLI